MRGANPYLIREPRREDIDAIAPHMRPMDVLECAAQGHRPAAALRLGLILSPLKWTVERDGQPHAVVGLSAASVVDRIGRPWMLGREDGRSGRGYMLTAPPLIEQMRAAYPRLENWAHRDNTSTLGWLSRLGFDVGDEMVQIGGQPFVRFSMGF